MALLDLLDPQTIAAVILCVTSIAAIHRWLNNYSKLPLPPGPPGHWLLGNTIPKAL